MTPAPPAVLTEELDGALVALALGTEVPLRLPSAWWWDVVAEGVTVTPVEHLADPGYREWLVTATEPGEASITAYGVPDGDADGDRGEQTVELSFTVTG
jgi:predicted secreted protein